MSLQINFQVNIFQSMGNLYIKVCTDQIAVMGLHWWWYVVSSFLETLTCALKHRPRFVQFRGNLAKYRGAANYRCRRPSTTSLKISTKCHNDPKQLTLQPMLASVKMPIHPWRLNSSHWEHTSSRHLAHTSITRSVHRDMCKESKPRSAFQAEVVFYIKGLRSWCGMYKEIWYNVTHS